MIHWWILPMLCTLAAVGMVVWTAADRAFEPYKGLMAFALAVVSAIVCAGVWAVAFTAKVLTP